MTDKKLITALLGISALLILVFGGLWWRQVYSDPQNVFQGMLDNSLRLQSVTKNVGQIDATQSVQQVVQLEFGAENKVRAITRLTQGEDASTVVETESIGTPTADYVRYTSIKTDQTKANGEPVDFSNVLNIWGKSATGIGIPATSGELYNETILGVIPFGVLKQADRQELLTHIKEQNIYEVDYANVEKTIQNGRPTYIYQVSIDPEPYVAMLKRFGELHGLNHLRELDPTSYAGQERLPFAITVDVRSRQLKRIDFEPNPDAATSRAEEYSGHNGRYNITTPTDVITVEELQARLQQLQ